jgi:hypothetical protein
MSAIIAKDSTSEAYIYMYAFRLITYGYRSRSLLLGLFDNNEIMFIRI